MPVHFTCPHCRQLLSVAEDYVGKAVRCVTCQGGVMVPLMSTGSESAELAAPASQPAGQSADGGVRSLAGRITIADPEMWNSSVSITRMALYSIGGLIIGVGILSFLLGWAMGTGSAMQRHSVAAANANHRIRGRLSYQTENGRTAADSEAVVVALPVGQKPDEKLAIETLRPDVAPPAKGDPTVQAIRSLGGDFARTNRTGDFELQVSGGGEYYLLLISNHQARREDSPPTTKEIVEVGSYFKPGDDLLGKNDFVWLKEVIGSDKQISHEFLGG